MKTILLVANRTNSFWFFRKEIIKKLIEKKYKVLMVANKDEYFKKFKEYNINFIEIKKNINSFSPLNILNIYIQLLIITLRHKPDIIQSYTIIPNLICPFLKVFYKCKIFIMITGMGYVLSSGNSLLLKLSIFLYRTTLIFCDHVIFTNKDNLNFFKRKKILKNTKYTMVPASGIDNKKYKKIIKFKKNKKETTFLFVGRLIKSKGILDLIYIFNKLKIKKKKLLLIGKEDKFSPEKVEIKDLIKKNNKIKHINESNNLEYYYNISDLFLFPSYSEGMPTVVMESFACGLPAITYKVPGCNDIIVNHKTGFKVKLYDKNKIIKIIEKEILNKNKLRTMSKNCLSYSKKFDRTVIVKKIIQLYDGCLQ